MIHVYRGYGLKAYWQLSGAVACMIYYAYRFSEHAALAGCNLAPILLQMVVYAWMDGWLVTRWVTAVLCVESVPDVKIALRGAQIYNLVYRTPFTHVWTDCYNISHA